MRTWIYILITAISSYGFAITESTPLNKAILQKKYFSARTILQNLKPKTLPPQDWLRIRSLLADKPLVGYDVLLKWDQQSPLPENSYDKEVRLADQLMLKKNFSQAFLIYQKVAKHIKNDLRSEKKANKLLYWSLLHSMARALYGDKRFSEALDVYRSVPSAYVYFRQVQFEKMWASYRANQMSYALGALASQTSGYFTKYLDPEAYLLQFYIYKRMCRADEAKKVAGNIRSYQKLLKSKGLPLQAWLGKDVENLIVKNLLLEARASGPEAAKGIFGLIKGRLNYEQKRVISQIDAVSAYVNLAEGGSKDLSPIRHLTEIGAILSEKTEKWDVDDKEVWADELGRHVFIGDDLCIKK